MDDKKDIPRYIGGQSTPLTRIEVVVTDGQLDPALKVICEAANTGKIGDGKVFVMNVEKSIRIRTGETDESAL